MDIVLTGVISGVTSGITFMLLWIIIGQLLTWRFEGHWKRKAAANHSSMKIKDPL